MNEQAMWKSADRGVKIFTHNGEVLVGRITWTSDHCVGFEPSQANDSMTLERLGMEASKESLLMKGFIRIMTPVRGANGQQARGSSPVQRLQPMAPPDRGH